MSLTGFWMIPVIMGRSRAVRNLDEGKEPPNKGMQRIANKAGSR
jgi:hypothetical protein